MQLSQLQQTKVELEAVVALLMCENDRLRQARCSLNTPISAPGSAQTVIAAQQQSQSGPAGSFGFGAQNAAPAAQSAVGGGTSQSVLSSLGGLAAAIPQLPTLQLSAGALESLRAIRATHPSSQGQGVLSGSALLSTPVSAVPQPSGTSALQFPQGGSLASMMPSPHMMSS
jgi:hypothetical protein